MTIIQTIRAKTVLHRRRIIAAYLHERTKQGKPTTVREIEAATGYPASGVCSSLRLMMQEPTHTLYGDLIVKQTGQRTSSAGVTAMTWAAILHNQNQNQ